MIKKIELNKSTIDLFDTMATFLKFHCYHHKNTVFLYAQKTCQT